MEVSTQRPLEFNELLHVHAGLRSELTTLYELSLTLVDSVVSQNEAWRGHLNSLLQQFDFFYVIFNSHSKAEDDVILPALTTKVVCGIGELPHELEDQHEGHEKFFDDIKLHLLPLRTEKAQNIANAHKEQLKPLVEHIAMLIEQLRAKVMLHFRKEEEELLPLLLSNFSREELIDLVGRIVGERSSELMQHFITIMSKSLSANDRDVALGQIKEAARGTLFSRWLEAEAAISDHMLDKGLVDEHKCRSVVQEPSPYRCKHYQRRCEILAPCCNKYFACRVCHDEFYENVVGQIHTVNRYKIERIRCLVCKTEQPVGKSCISCKVSFSKYSCLVCRLYDDCEKRSIYHCPFCNVCRAGKNLGEDYYHCMKCNACVNVNHREHRCVEKCLESSCPICFSDMFSSTIPIKELPCGHFMHRTCFQNYTKNGFKCPICRKAIINMRNHWQQFDSIIENYLCTMKIQNRMVNFETRFIQCNECSLSGNATRPVLKDIPYSIPFKCPQCATYNTTH